ncbi:amino acid adenylation domain-containing protein [Pusillimonas sp. MFBS29]|uniref:non-ribosomal peptide synthetase n=1 Tax=Pusillimonas sp. MFBS29 TaxID=2886690 RepID=UPI001D122824|nr:non-ribosomal peptide synthetase [Pusillimonas sp. MFBS29]MCC2597576.1 amino acid adenylation domain-containing protein [Pusillimonas sp. MFBS29]
MSSGYIAAASFAQRQLRYLDLLQPGRSDYAVPLLIEISAPVDAGALRRAFNDVVQRHDVLRAGFPLVDGVPVQAIRDDLVIALPKIDIPGASRELWQQGISAALTQLAQQAFDLDQGPAVHARIFMPCTPDTAGCGMALAVVFHHAVADGASLPLFLDDLITAYNAALTGSEPGWPELPLQYPDYADWEQEQFGAPDAPALADALRYWREQLHHVPAMLDLPLDASRGHPADTGATQTLMLAGTTGAALTEAARQRGATPFMALLAVFFAVLHRWSGLEDLTVSIPVSKRTRPELAGLIGLLVDTLPLRIQCNADTSYDALLEQVQHTFRDAVRHRDVPFQRIVQAIDIERHADVTPLMQVLFGALESSGAPQAANDGSRYAVVDDQTEQSAKSDISLVYRQTPEHLELWCRYEPSLFRHSTIANLLAWFGEVAAAAAAKPATLLADLPLISRQAGLDLIRRFNDTSRPYDSESSIVTLFDDIAQRFPNSPAIEENGTVISYADLALSSAQIASALAATGIGPGDSVVIVIPPGARYLTLVLAILRAGAIYVPMDPAHPHAHRRRLAKTIGARAVLLTGNDERDYDGPDVLDINALEAQAADLPALLPRHCDPSDTAYIMFTSGSTGEPKGVAVPQRAILRLVRNTNFARFGPHTRAALYSNPAFDASTLELWAPLLNGGTVVALERGTVLDATQLRRALNENNITMLWITTGLFHEMAAIDPGLFAGERLVLTGGDTTNLDLVRAVYRAGRASGLTLLHAYGPTENTTFSACFDAADLHENDIQLPLGPPVANSTVYVLDRHGNPLPPGINGELYVGGDGVATAYVNDPGRTASAFLPDPFSNKAGARMYRTGDFGRWRDDGMLLFAGRADDQVKVRGFRIELNEITAALGRHPDLRMVHVAAPRLGQGERQIIAYVVPDSMPGPTPAELRQFLQSQLPPHMLPHAYVSSKALALNLNGKVDRKALPAVEDHHYDRAAGLLAPRNHEETVLQAIWQDLLGLDAIGITESFFHIGGDSILAIRMAARASEAGYAITPADIFQLQTIERLAALVVAAQPRSRRGTARIFPAELLPEASGAAASQPFLLASLVLDRPIRAVDLALAVQRLAERHDALRLRCVREGQASHLEIAAYVGQLPIRMVEARHLADADIDRWVAEHAARIGRGLDTHTGVTLAATLVDRGEAMPPVVILAVHPGAADQASLMLLLGELNTALRIDAAPLPPMPEAGLNYGDWLSWLQEYADDQAAGTGLAALESPALRDAAPPELLAHETPLRIRAQHQLPATLCDTLFGQVTMQLAITPLDMLAAALNDALRADQGPLLLEAMETARRLPDGAPDAHRIVGKIDSVTPMLTPAGSLPLPERLRAIKSARQAVADTGCVYRTLCQAFDLPTAALGLAWTNMPLVQHTMRLHTPPVFSASVTGALLARLAGGQLCLSWAGAEPAMGAGALLERIAETLQDMTKLADQDVRPLYTANDFPLARVAGPALDALLSSSGQVQDIYPLSPMQEAMLVHTLTASDSGVNFEQSCVRIRGALDLDAFVQAWTVVFERHDVLRTAFHWRGLERPLQVVQRKVKLPLAVQTWPRFDPERLQALLASDQARGFQLEQAPLVRLTLVKVADDDIYLVSSFHHLLIDGWCLGRLEREVRAAYESFRSRRAPLFDTVIPYRSYIAWLEKEDHADSKAFFTELLRNSPERRLLFAPASQAARRFNTQRHTLDKQASRALTAFARRRGLTLAAVMHYAWATWLAARLGTSDVVFGTTVSGRPASIPGVEHIVGLFINNVPVRARLDDADSPASQLAAIQVQLGQLQQHAHLSPAEIAAAADGNHPSGPLFDTLVLVENLASGTSAWSGAEGLQVETVHTRLKTAYDLTFVVIPGESLVLSLIQPEDGRELEDTAQALRVIADMLVALPAGADGRHDALPHPDARPALPLATDATRMPLQFATKPRSTLEARIAAAVAGMVAQAPGLKPDLDTDFWLLGLTSLGITQLAIRLQDMLDRPVSISLLLEHRSVAALAHALESDQRWSPVVPMNQLGVPASQNTVPFICVHPVAGDVSVFLDLARALPAQLPFWAIQAAGLEQGQQALHSIPDMAAANLAALAERGQASPLWLGGYSFGGLVAFEMARQLAACGRPPERVVLVDTPAPLERSSILDSDPERADAQWLVRMADVRARFQGQEPVLTQEELLAEPAGERYEFACRRLHGAKLLPPAADAQWLQRAHSTSMAQYQAYLDYQPAPGADQALPLALIRASAPRDSDLGRHENQLLALPDMGWQAYTTRPVDIRHVAGDHVTMLSGDSAHEVAQAIAELLIGPECSGQ